MMHLVSARLAKLLTLITVLAISISACQSDKQSDSNKLSETTSTTAIKTIPSLRPLITAENTSVVEAAFLRKNLPESAFAYIRIPNAWSFVGTAKGNVFDNAINSKPFYEAISGIRQGFSENVIPEIPEKEAQLLFKLLLNQLTSPIEVIAIDGIDPAIPTPNLVLSTAAGFNSTSEVQELLTAIENKSPVIEITKAITAEGYAEFKIAHMNAQLQWDQQQKRLTLLVGVSLSPKNLTDLIKTFTPNTTHSMLALESDIDESGQGLFAWANPRKLTSMASTMGMQKELAPLAIMGVNTVKNIALGAGTSKGINRIKYLVEMPVTGFRSYMPIVKTTPEFQLAGKTKVLGVLGLPSLADFVSIENTIALVTPSRDMKKYYEAKKSFKDALGFSVDDLFEFFGQDMSIVSDEAGIYAAIRLNNAKKFKTTLAKSVKDLSLNYQEKVISGHTYHHLQIPSIYNYLDKTKKEELSGEGKLLIKRFLSVPSHVYWEQEGDYLMLSNIPQTLIDRHYIATKTKANDWLLKQQRIDPSNSLMMLSLRNQDTAEMMYRMHLGLLNYLADFTGKPIDMFALATPREAKLPKESSYGFKVTSSETQLAFELNFESNPLEFLLAGNAYEGVAILGILSAIAVPAYDDYLVRSEIAAGYIAANSIKIKLDQFEIEYGRYPNQYEIEDLNLNDKTTKYTIEVEPNTGIINAKFKSRKLFGSRDSLSLLPPKRGESTEWQCKSMIVKKYLPVTCR